MLLDFILAAQVTALKVYVENLKIFANSCDSLVYLKGCGLEFINNSEEKTQ